MACPSRVHTLTHCPSLLDLRNFCLTDSWAYGEAGCAEFAV